MDENLFQNIFDRLSDLLPKDWKTVVFYAGYTQGSYSMKFYVDSGNGQYQDCYNIPEITDLQLIQVFMAIDDEIVSVRNKLEEKWTVLTLIVDSEGDFKTYFDYTDISETAIEYQIEWEKQYLV